MKLLLADDHSLFREAMVEYIERMDPGAQVSVARDLHETLQILRNDRAFDLILLDMGMPGMDGLQGLRQLREMFPDIAAALLSGLAEETDVEKALALGARGYFPKTLSGKAMMSGIRQIIAGDIYVATELGTNKPMPSHYGANGAGREGDDGAARIPANPAHRLTPREKQVLEFLLRGQSNKEIARALDLQVVTVKLHVRGICRKLGARNRTQAALLARAQGY